MFYLIENKEQLQLLQEKNFNDVFIEVIPNNDLIHPKLQEISLIYIRPIEYKHGFILVIDHNEGLSLHKSSVRSYISSIEEKYTLNKKNLLYFFQEGDIHDLNFVNFINKDKIINHTDFNTDVHNHFYSQFDMVDNINSIIPIVKHFEKYENIFDKVLPLVKSSEIRSKDYVFYNEDLVPAFWNIEKNGLKISIPDYIEYFDNPSSYRFLNDDKLFTQYNLYNTTLRPSNAFNGLNFAALNKTNGERSTFIPENDLLVEFDFKSYHLYILMELIQFKIPKESDIHTELGKIYFNKEKLTPEEYKESKQKTFHILYTDEIKKYRHIPFFKAVEDYKTIMWEEYKKKGYIKVGPTKMDKFSYPTQMLPHILQNIETFYNVSKINDICKYLEDKKTKLILYSYDSFLFDYSEQDGDGCLNFINDILEAKTFKCGIKRGKTLQSIQ